MGELIRAKLKFIRRITGFFAPRPPQTAKALSKNYRQFWPAARRQTRNSGKIATAACDIANCLADEMLEGPVDHLTDVDCHESALETVVDKCGGFTDYALRYSRLFVNLCNAEISMATISAEIEKGCSQSVVV